MIQLTILSDQQGNLQVCVWGLHWKWYATDWDHTVCAVTDLTSQKSSLRLWTSASWDHRNRNVCVCVFVPCLYCMSTHCQALRQIPVTTSNLGCSSQRWPEGQISAFLSQNCSSLLCRRPDCERVNNMEAVLLQQHWTAHVSQAGAEASCFAWVGIEVRISIFCSTEHLNVFTNAIWVT